MSSLWELESCYAPRDVVIAGGGMAGLWSAYYLKVQDPSLRIMVLERNIVPTGASTRNAGFACFGSVTELMQDVNECGKEKMLELVAMRYDGLRRINKVFEPQEIDYQRCGGYELITGKQYSSEKAIRKDIDWLNNSLEKVIQKKKVFKLADKKISRFNFQQTDHLVEAKLEGQLHPGKMVQALTRKLQGMGVVIRYGVELKAYEEAVEKVIIHTAVTDPFYTSQLLICTNGFASNLLSGTPIIPARGQVLVTSPVNDLPFKGTFHYDEGYYYFRNVGNRVLLGGARNTAFDEEQTSELNVSDSIQQELERFLHERILPRQNFTIDHRWSGIMGMGSTKFPTVRQLSASCFCLLGLGGMGVALAPVSGEQVAKMMVKNR